MKDEEEQSIMLGTFEVEDVERLLPELKGAGISFEIEEKIEIRKAFKGTEQPYSLFCVWIGQTDQKQAEEIQNRCLKIML